MYAPGVLGGQRGHRISRDWVSDAKPFLYFPLPQGFLFVCLFVFKYFNYVSVCLYEELKLVVNCTLWVLGTKLSSSARALQALNH